LQLLFAVALGAGGVVGRPVFDIGGERAGQFQRLVMRLGRQRDDEVEIQALPVVEFLKSGRLVGGDVLAETANGSSSPFLTPAERT
jgi:hypothetical protein